MRERRINLAPYRGSNPGLSTQITEFYHAFKLLNSHNVRDDIKRKIIFNVEQRILVIERIALDGTDYDKRWIAANIKELGTIHEECNRIRSSLNLERPIEVAEQMNETERGIHQAEINYFNSKEVKKSAGILGGAIKGAIVGGTGAAVTGISAFSFFGGPIVGGAVTGSVASISAIATGVAVKTGYDEAYKKAHIELETAIRNEFRN